MSDPSTAEVIDALLAANAAANAGHSAGNLSPIASSAPAIAERVLRESDGMTGHFGAASSQGDIARLSVGWWSDATGRKFVRVRSWREHNRRYDEAGHQTVGFDRSERDRHRRPGVWHVDWERVVEASSGGEPEWVAVCGCGAAGSPVSLAWQSGMCGPCADRIAEFGPAAVAHTPGLLADAGFEPERVAFAPDGTVLAGGANSFRVWSAAGERLAYGNVGDEPDAERFVPQMQASPDGQFVLVSTTHRRLMFLDITTTPFRTEYLNTLMNGGGKWTGRPNELLFYSDSNGSTYLIETITGQTRPTGPQPDRHAEPRAIWPNASAPRVVFALGYHISVARLGADDRFAVESRFLLGDGQLNRTGVWHGGPELVLFTPDGERLLFVRGREMELRHPAKPKALLQTEFSQSVRDAAFSPDYEQLFILGVDGVIHVCNPGTLTGVRARLRWHLGPVYRLAVSPDGQTLATAGPEGVKLWPISQLLPLLG